MRRGDGKGQIKEILRKSSVPDSLAIGHQEPGESGIKKKKYNDPDTNIVVSVLPHKRRENQAGIVCYIQI